MIQKLNDQGVPPTHIIQISGHKNVVQSLKTTAYCLNVNKETFSIFLVATLKCQGRQATTGPDPGYTDLFPKAQASRGVRELVLEF